jgi:hypothetical protein
VPMNRFKARVPIVGFAQALSPLPDTALPLLTDAATGQNIWLITAGFPPAAPDNAVEEWLTFNAFNASDEWLEDVRLVWYGVGQPTVARSINVTLGEELQLVRINVAESPQPGQVLPVELAWMPLQRPSADYNLFLQLLAADGALIAQHDSPPNGGYAPTSSWLPGQEVSDRHGLALPSDLPAGTYRLIAGMVNPATGQRLRVDKSSDFVELGRIALPPSER